MGIGMDIVRKLNKEDEATKLHQQKIAKEKEKMLVNLNEHFDEAVHNK